MTRSDSLQRTPLPEGCSTCVPALPPDDAEDAEVVAAASMATLSRLLLFLQIGIVQRRVKK